MYYYNIASSISDTVAFVYTGAYTRWLGCFIQLTQDKFLQAGGTLEGGSHPPNSLAWVFSLASGVWTQVPDYPGTKIPGCTRLPNGNVSHKKD